MKNMFNIVIVFLLSLTLKAAASPLCTDLSKYSCAPGSYSDVTGKVKGSVELQKQLSAYVEKSHTQLNNKFNKILTHNDYFKSLALAALGLKNSPMCVSEKLDDQNRCQTNLAEGLTELVQRQTLNSLMPQSMLSKTVGLVDFYYVIQDENYRQTASEFAEATRSEFKNTDMEKKIKEKIFPDIKLMIEERINKSSASVEQKKIMISKIKSIQFAGTDCAETNQGGGGYGGTTPEPAAVILIPNAFYDPNRNIFKYCSGLITASTSEFQISMIIAHELSHSIDPCTISSGPADFGFKYSNNSNMSILEKETPFSNVVSCLRQKNSIQAQNHTLRMAEKIKGSSLDPSMARISFTPNANTERPLFCNNDQVTESFCDWMALEVVPDYIEKNYKNTTTSQYKEGYANTYRTMCKTTNNIISQGADDHGAVHPLTIDRINKILLVNPKVRKQMGCPAEHPTTVYCPSEPPAAAEPAVIPKAITTPQINSNPTEGGIK